MRRAALSLLAACLIAACSKVTQENFLKVEEGSASRWVSGDAVITVRFVNGKVALKSFEKSLK